MKDFKLRMPGDEVCNKRVLGHAKNLGWTWQSGQTNDYVLKTHDISFLFFEIYLTHAPLEYEKNFLKADLKEITLAEFFALKPEPEFPMTFDDCPGANFYYDSVSFSVSISGCSYEMLDKAVKHADEIREMKDGSN